MEALTLKLPPEMARWVEDRAERTRRPKSAVIREALERLRDAEAEGSVLDAAGDAVGRVSSGTRDLGSNKRHLRDFGR